MPTDNERLLSLYKKKEKLLFQMPMTFEDLRIKNRDIFLIDREIEKLEDPESYEKNINYWEEKLT